MDFKRIDAAVATCKSHIDATGARGTEIESFLVSYLLVTIAADFEIRLEAIVSKRAERTADPHIQSFVRVAAGRIIRGIKISEITGVLGHFGSDCKESFSKEIADTLPHTCYDNILANRHMVAHQTGPNMTFAELETALPESKKVLDAVASALGLTATELSGLE